MLKSTKVIYFPLSILWIFQMSLATNSPAHSSSSDDFAAFLAVDLDSHSSDSSPDEETEGDNNAESERYG